VFLKALPQQRRGQAFAMLAIGLMALHGVGPVLFGVLAELTSPAVDSCVAGATVLLAPGLRRCLRPPVPAADTA
jgi:MFS-type transporter involved in bile tolerance (Atg22 family)